MKERTENEKILAAGNAAMIALAVKTGKITVEDALARVPGHAHSQVTEILNRKGMI